MFKQDVLIWKWGMPFAFAFFLFLCPNWKHLKNQSEFSKSLYFASTLKRTGGEKYYLGSRDTKVQGHTSPDISKSTEQML